MKSSRSRRPAVDQIDETRQSTDALRRLALDNILDAEALRARIARALHDGLGQSLSVLNLQLYWLARHCDDEKRVRAKLVEMQQTLASTGSALDRLARDCRPLCPPADAALADILECQVRQCRNRHGIPCAASIPRELPALPSDHVVAIVHLMVRCLDTLAVDAQGLAVSCEAGTDCLGITIRVTGAGNGAAGKRPTTPGIEAWVRALGGACNVRGNALAIMLPLPTEFVRRGDGADLPAQTGKPPPPTRT